MFESETIGLIQTHATLEPLKVMVLTWNVNAKIELKSEMRSLFFGEGDTKDDFPEIVAVGFQEVVELSTSNVVGSAIAGQGKDRVNKWQEQILETFQAEGLQFDVVASIDMVGLWLAVFAVHRIRPCISKVQVSSFARGVGGVLGNKGAVYARMDILDTSICFVNAHFAAHREQVLKRNEDFHAILSHKCFPDYLSTNIDQLFSTTTKSSQTVQVSSKVAELRKQIANYDVVKNNSAKYRQYSAEKGPNGYLAGQNSRSFATELPRHCADDHDIVIWFGDLNYRIVTGLDMSIVYDMIESKRSIYLAPYDQLNQEREAGRVFNHFHEGLLTFDPTYQYIPGKDAYDNRKDKKLRCPAWCDRVLWRIGKHSATESEEEFEDVTASSAVGGAGSAASTVMSPSAASPRGVHGGESDSDDDERSAVSSITATLPMLTPTPSTLEVEANLNTELSSPQPPKDPVEGASGKQAGRESKRVMEEFDCEETVELMYYNRCGNVISDHKPVRAVLNVKIKKVDWAASELSLIEEYKQRCPVTNPLNAFINQIQPTNFSTRTVPEEHLMDFVYSPVSVVPRSTKFYSLLANAAPASLSHANSGATDQASLLSSPVTSPGRPSSINRTQIQLVNHLAHCGVQFTIVPSSIPSWLVLSSSKGVMDCEQSVTIGMTTNQAAVNTRAMDVQDSYKIYNNLTSLGRYIVNNHNFNAHSVELYAMLEIELRLFTPAVYEGSSARATDKEASSVGGSSSKVVSSGEPVLFDTLHVPVICCAEHTVPPIAAVA